MIMKVNDQIAQKNLLLSSFSQKKEDRDEPVLKLHYRKIAKKRKKSQGNIVYYYVYMYVPHLEAQLSIWYLSFQKERNFLEMMISH